MDVGDAPGTTPETVPSAAVAVIILNSTSHFRSGAARTKEGPTRRRGEDIVFPQLFEVVCPGVSFLCTFQS